MRLSDFNLIVDKSYPELVNCLYSIKDNNYSPIRLCELVSKADNELPSIESKIILTVVIKYYIPYSIDNGTPVTLKVVIGKKYPSTRFW